MKALNRGPKKRKCSSGFTLVELMIVIVIMIILAAAATPLFLGYVQRAKDSRAIAECRQVVQAAQVKAQDLYAAGLLKVTQTNNTISAHNKEIIELANVKGKIEQGPTVDESSQVVFVLYECENGVRVRYDVTKNPKYVVETADAPLTVIKNWNKTTDDFAAEFFQNNKVNVGYDRYRLYQDMVQSGKITKLEVDKEFWEGTEFKIKENEKVHWLPYYIGPDKNNVSTILYALPETLEGKQNWKASLVYIDGEVYVSGAKDGRGNAEGTNIAELKNCKSFDEARELMKNIGFELKK